MKKKLTNIPIDPEARDALTEQYRAGLAFSLVNVGSYDPAAAAACLQKCAESGHIPDAYFVLGLLSEQNQLGAHISGDATAEHKSVKQLAEELCLTSTEARALAVSAAREQAQRMYEAGHMQGSVKCTYALGAMLSATNPKAREYFFRARTGIASEASAGDAISAHINSKYYALGIGGCAKNRQSRMYWLSESAELGYAPAQAELARCYRVGDGVSVNEALAYEYFQRAADAGNIDGRVGRAICLLHGEGVAKDAALAVELLEGLEKTGFANGEVLFALGECHLRGVGHLKINRQQASIRYRRAAEIGNADAQLVLGKHIQQNIKSDAEHQRAYELFFSAAQNSNAEANYETGRCLLLGLGVPKNYAAALWHLSAAADKNLSEAQYLLGVAYQSADLKRRDYAKAYACFLAAAAQGHEQAKAAVEECRAKAQGIDTATTDAG